MKLQTSLFLISPLVRKNNCSSNYRWVWCRDGYWRGWSLTFDPCKVNIWGGQISISLTTFGCCCCRCRCYASCCCCCCCFCLECCWMFLVLSSGFQRWRSIAEGLLLEVLKNIFFFFCIFKLFTFCSLMFLYLEMQCKRRYNHVLLCNPTICTIYTQQNYAYVI